MATENAVGRDWESQAEVDAILAETGVTMDQVRRWRREGLLPDVVQDQLAYRGSVVLYPKGTSSQIRAASVLFKQKNCVEYVGLRLWIYGFRVDEKFWRPRLNSRDASQTSSLHLPARFRGSLRPTFERKDLLQPRHMVKISQSNNIVLSRIKRRVVLDRLPAFMQVMEEVGRGDSVGFGHVVAGEDENNRSSGHSGCTRFATLEEGIQSWGISLNLLRFVADRPRQRLDGDQHETD